MRRQRGFSLIELLIVVAIILALAAMAIPNLLRSKMSANEASAVSSLHAIANAQTTYQITYPDLGYADLLTKLAYPPPGQPIDGNHAGIIDWVLGCVSQPCPKSGYQFSIGSTVGTPVSAYVAVGTPLLVGQTGRRGFCSNQAAQVSYDPNGGASCTMPLQ
ncbi:MAG: type II secretion system GspH family protein [Acidobacteriia bacterium]|nr:type II secretion system GspH family protein [Terriglobia bacterium]